MGQTKFIEDALNVPSITQNLLFLGTKADQAMKIKFESSRCLKCAIVEMKFRVLLTTCF